MNDLELTLPVEDKEVLRLRDIEAQLRLLHSPVPNIRAAAARRLGDLTAGIDDLLDALKDPSEIVRASAAMALGSFDNSERSSEIGEYLLTAIDDTSERVCQSAIRSLGMLRILIARDEIETFLDETNPYILGAAILALARLKANDLSDRLALFIHHESPYVQMQSVRAAAVLGYTPIGPQIIRLLEKTRASRHSAGFTDPSASRDRQANDLYNLQNQLIRAAGELRLKDASSQLIDTVQKDIGFRGLAVEALIKIGADIDTQVLARLLSDPGIYLRKRLLALFAQTNYRPALPLLRPLLNDENTMIRITALQALTEMQDAESLPRIAWISSHDPNPFLRVQAVQSLVALSGESALPTLLALARDANFQVRRAAAAYLVEWKNPSANTHSALAQFAADFPEDDLSAVILRLFAEQGIDPTIHLASPPLTASLIPDSINNQRELLIDLLELWQQALEKPTSGDALAAKSALGLLMDILTSQPRS